MEQEVAITISRTRTANPNDAKVSFSYNDVIWLLDPVAALGIADSLYKQAQEILNEQSYPPVGNQG